MPRIKQQNKHEYDDDDEKQYRLVDTSTRKSLMIPRMKYTIALRRFCKHNNYLKGFHTLRKQVDIPELPPTFDDFMVGTESFFIDLPYPIVKPYDYDKEVDFCNQIFVERSKYNAKLRSSARCYKSDQKWLTKSRVERTKYAKLPKYMIDLAVGNVKDPDEQLVGFYNWYYAGGILSKFYSNDNEYLICPLPDNNLRIVNINDSNNDVKLDCDLQSNPVLNLFVDNDSNGDKILVMRQRNSINMFHLLGDDNFLLLHIFKASTRNDNPFLDVKRNSNEIAYLDYNRKLTITDIDNKKSRRYRFEKGDHALSDPFCQLEYFNENTVGFIDRNTLRVLDDRSFHEQILYTTNNTLFLCDDLCYVKELVDSPYLFLATVHNLHKIDTRTNKIVKTWAHMLSGQPSMLKIQESIYGNMIFLSSEKFKERVILCSNEDESNLVQLVPNNYETFRECNIADFDLNSDLYENRLKFSTAGIEISQNENLSLYTCNTLGDIFQSNVRTYKEDIDLSLWEFRNWRRNFKKKPSPCIVSHLKDMSYAKFILKKPIRDDALERYTKSNTKRLEYIAENTIEGSAFAHIWVTDETIMRQSLAPAVSTDSKVFDWLEGVNYDELNEEE